MSISTGLIRLNARKYFLSCKSRSYSIARSLSFAERIMVHKESSHLIERSSLLSMGIASDRRCTKLDSRSNTTYQLRLYSSEAAAHDAENMTEETSHNEAQQENPSAESKKATPRLSKRGERFRNEFLSRIVPWEKIPISFDSFPYYIECDDTKTLLVECMASHLKHESKFRKYGSILRYSSNRIQIQSIPGTELYRERLVSAVARELQVPLLKLDSCVLPPYDTSHKYSNNHISKEDSLDSYSVKDDSDEDDSNEDDSSEEDDIAYEQYDTSAKSDGICQLKKGDRVMYVGDTTSIEEAKDRTLSLGNRGEVHEVNGEKVSVIFNVCGLERKEKEEKSTEKTAQIVTWLEAKNVKLGENAHVHDCYIAMELLYEVLESGQPIVVYFPDSFFSSMSEAPWSDSYYFFDKAKKMFRKLSGRVVLISGQNITGSKKLRNFLIP